MAIDLNFDSGWPNYEWNQAKALTKQVKSILRPRQTAGSSTRYIVEPGDSYLGSTGERAEGTYYGSDEQLYEGSFKWYGWSTWFPSGEAIPSNFRIFNQWHADSNFTQAPIKIDGTNGSGVECLTVRFNAGLQSGPSTWEHNRRYTILDSLVHDARYDFCLGIKWSHTANGEFRLLLRNFNADEPFRRYTLTDIPTMVWSTAAGIGDLYWKQGLYTNDSTFTRSIIHDNPRRADTRDEILSAWSRVSLQRGITDLSGVSL